MTFGLIVEGPYDVPPLTELIRKCYQGHVKVEARVCRGSGDLMKNFPRWLREFTYRGDIHKALVVRDADRKDLAQLRAQMHAKIANRTYPFAVKIAIIVQELEAWLLADHEAISVVTGRQTARLPDPIEGIDSPKQRLRVILSTARLAYTAPLAGRIAAEANTRRLAERCPAFRTFCQNAADC